MLCGATLIDHHHALSAAHCFVTDDFASGVGYIPPEKFVFQINRYTSRLKEVKYLQPEWIRCHENYIQGKACHIVANKIKFISKMLRKTGSVQ